MKLDKDILEGDIKILKSKMIKCDEIEQKNNKTFGARGTLSRQMRHPQPTASKNY